MEDKQVPKSTESSKSTSKRFHWKGRYVSEKVYNHRVFLANASKKRKLESDAAEKPTINIEGRRIVNLAELTRHMKCTFCSELLSLEYIEKEIRRGLASIFEIRCHHCLLVNKVPTDTQTESEKGYRNYSVNLKAAMGTLHSGMGCSHLNNLLASMNIPYLNSNQFKYYESEVGTATESVAKKSCEEATKLERELTIQNINDLQEMLPDNLPANFLIPSRPSPLHTLNNIIPEDHEVVRLMVSYDMGWSKRGTGRNYDSLNGYGALIGSQSGYILDYGTRNRKCRKCDFGISKDRHDCRLNFQGSAKAMEPDLAVELCVHSKILKEAKTEVGILIGDDDSLTIAAVRRASDHAIVKFSDHNHTAKGVTKALYNVQKQHKELTKEAIDYLHRCFTYAVSQNKGNSLEIASILHQIPDHAFNRHEKCGEWCRFNIEKENYEHSSIPGGFCSPSLYQALVNIFGQLAKNVEKFAHGMSSQGNENLNAVMASKTPKSRCYCLSASSDYRFAISVVDKNLGPGFFPRVMSTIGLSPGRHTSSYIQSKEMAADQRKKRIKTSTFKARRNILKKYRALLRNKQETREGTTYQSNMGLLQCQALFDLQVPETSDEAIIFFDLETSSLSKTAEVLQIGARFNEKSFGVYVNPTRPIAFSASAVNGLTNESGELFLHGIRVASRPLHIALGEFLKFLLAIEKPCVLVAHNCKFDSTRLLHAIESAVMLDGFRSVISGFTDTLPIFRKVLKKKINAVRRA